MRSLLDGMGLVSFIVIGSLLAMPQTQSGPTTGPPCANQSRTFAQLRRAFVQGRLPSPIDTTGTWVAIGFFGDAESHGKDLAHLNCAGLKRGSKYERGMVIVRYSIETHFVGTLDQRPIFESDGAGSVVFPIDFGGDASPEYRCRITAQDTLACLIDVYRQGVEFRKMSVDPRDLYTCKSFVC